MNQLSFVIPIILALMSLGNAEVPTPTLIVPMSSDDLNLGPKKGDKHKHKHHHCKIEDLDEAIDKCAKKIDSVSDNLKNLDGGKLIYGQFLNDKAQASLKALRALKKLKDDKNYNGEKKIRFKKYFCECHHSAKKVDDLNS